MEKHTCKLCSRTFANGRALGGHMRSHVIGMTHLGKTQEAEEGKESSPSSTSSSSEEEDEGKAQALYYGLRENPKKSFRLVDPEFSFAIDASSVVQDRESETESSKNPFRRRSKRHRKSKLEQEHEPASSVSDTTPEEDVALSLMMLSRDIWMRDFRKAPFEEFEEDEEENGIEHEEEQEEEEKMRFCPRGRNKYQCGTCKKVFRSYQALGGHRASHKKIKTCTPPSPAVKSQVPNSRIGAGNRRIHECPFCFRVFKSGQALGGHKRSHLSASASASASASPSAPTPPKFGDSLIDLNLPAPLEDDDFSQVELSAVSDAEFVDPTN